TRLPGYSAEAPSCRAAELTRAPPDIVRTKNYCGFNLSPDPQTRQGERANRPRMIVSEASSHVGTFESPAPPRSRSNGRSASKSPLARPHRQPSHQRRPDHAGTVGQGDLGTETNG